MTVLYGVWGRTAHFMDIESPNKEVSKDLARESLIAISNLLPDNVLGEDVSLLESLSNGNGVAAVNSDITEKYRTELISISYGQSPDAKPKPVALNREG
ncbi:uncharacterized protein LOC116206364 [Punica granatum]|uniref:Uncharacterized protein n=2 Tax=Punica granatum TaxID=22663 RepID=A0A2I0ISC8_PUNGR|nr:uncharacterized protein LOC116206364 [Punica granatum]PKI46901.1 hypothetical protein CRG98_032712 [Punica granatum]